MSSTDNEEGVLVGSSLSHVANGLDGSPSEVGKMPIGWPERAWDPSFASVLLT